MEIVAKRRQTSGNLRMFSKHVRLVWVQWMSDVHQKTNGSSFASSSIVEDLQKWSSG